MLGDLLDGRHFQQRDVSALEIHNIDRFQTYQMTPPGPLHVKR